eukprot:3653208-Rhodomonas_salina.3
MQAGAGIHEAGESMNDTWVSMISDGAVLSAEVNDLSPEITDLSMKRWRQTEEGRQAMMIGRLHAAPDPPGSTIPTAQYWPG